ncbi:MAG TPA: hypothetical protein RMH99_27980 [Sandaracinaceae bacterium LLY-WYZ-13_1]|nr:hypothetical protein [Sandaracinaceae bacterium LLY-WYZ-13_1]
MSDEPWSGPTRRAFLGGTLGVAGAVFLAACDDGSDGTDAGPSGTDAGPEETDAGPFECGDVVWEMGNRHPPGFRHTLDITLADVTAGAEKTYDITGDSDHPHTVVVTADHFATIAEGGTVEIESSEDDMHTHVVTLMCSAA